MLHLRGDNDGAQLSSRQKVHVRDHGHICYVESCAGVNLCKKKKSFLEAPLILRYTALPAKMILSTSCFEELFHVVIVDVKRYMKEAHQKSLEMLHQHINMQVLQMAHKKSSKIGPSSTRVHKSATNRFPPLHEQPLIP